MIDPPSSKPGGRTAKPTIRELRQQLAERDRQLAERDQRLAELAEQSLQILDRLAEAREQEREHGKLHARIAELQELLVDTRQRIRVASRAVLGREQRDVGRAEVVVWNIAPGDGDRVAALLAAVGDTAVTLLLGSGVEPAEFRREHTAALSVQESEWRTPSHAWNEAMAMTQADVVVVLTPHALPAADAVGKLGAAAGADGVAVASPCLVRDGGRSLGRVERSLLELEPLEVGDADAARERVETVPFPSPEAFAISRAAFHELGAFDQDLLGDLALAEWTLRAAAHTQRCVGVVDAEVRVGALRVEAPGPALEADRLVVLSRHRPQQLATAALAAQVLWQQEPMALANVLRSVFRRLPHAGELSGAVDLLVVQAQTIAGWKRLAPALRERLVALAGVLGVPVPDAVSEPGLVTLSEQLQGAAAAQRDRLREYESSGLDGEVRELRQDCLARANTIDRLRQELIEREQAIAALKEEHGKRVGERDRLIDHLAAVQEQIEAERRRIRELERQLVGERDRLVEQQDLLVEQQERLVEQQARAQERLDEQKVRIRELEQQLAGESTNLQAVLREIDEFRSGQETLMRERSTLEVQSQELERRHSEVMAQRDRLQVETGSLQERRVELESRAHELVVTLRDRERWIVALLQDLRRWRPWPRRLSAKEVEFLQRQGVDDGQPRPKRPPR